MEENNINKLAETFDFTLIPDTATEKIFEYLTFDEVTELRLVNKWFNYKCGNILNEVFKSLPERIDEQIEYNLDKIKRMKVDEKSSDITQAYMRNKILHIVKSEYKTLNAVCGRYIKYNSYKFIAGKILDCCNKILIDHVSARFIRDPLESKCIIDLLLYNDDFLDYFEEKVESNILDNNPTVLFASKVVDILDNYANTNYHIAASCVDNNSCHIIGQYEILRTELITQPPKLYNKTPNAKLDDILTISRYLRNQMRWYNFFYFMDATHNELVDCKKNGKKYSKLCLNPQENCKEYEEDIDIFQNENGESNFNKIFSRRLGNPFTTTNISYAIELKCSKLCAPSRFDHLISTEVNGEYDLSSLKAIVEDSTRFYDFNLTLKIILPPADEEKATENCLELFHDKDGCLITEKECEIPI